MTIVVECGNDEQLMRLLGVPRKRIKHQGNRDEVVKQVMKDDPGASIGLVDEDPGTARANRRASFKVVDRRTGLVVEQAGEHKLVVLEPFLEGWLVEAVKATGSSMTTFGKELSDDPRELHKVLSPKGDPRLEKIVAHLEEHGSTHIRDLRDALGLKAKQKPKRTARRGGGR